MSESPSKSRIPGPNKSETETSGSTENLSYDTESQHLLNTPSNPSPSGKGDYSFNPNNSNIGLKSKEEQDVASFAAMANPTDEDDGFGGMHHQRSWSGSLSEFAAGLFGPISPHSHEKPPPAPRSRSIEEERKMYHDRNSKFLKLAEKQKSKISPPKIWSPRR
jgi:hypothetical protein